MAALTRIDSKRASKEWAGSRRNLSCQKRQIPWRADGRDVISDLLECKENRFRFPILMQKFEIQLILECFQFACLARGIIWLESFLPGNWVAVSDTLCGSRRWQRCS